MSNEPKVLIFMATFNGERYLGEQLESLVSQTYSNWDLVISDDGSVDGTVQLVSEFISKYKGTHFVKLVDGPKQGFVKNFLSLSMYDEIDAEYYAFCDQDDVWNKDKIARAVRVLSKYSSSTPLLYCTRTEIVGPDASSFKPARFSPLISLQPSFSNSLVQSIAGGNTMVFNRSAKDLIKKFGGLVDVPSHDWWLYQLVSGVGGIVVYDSIPSLRYRQHSKNLVGANRTLHGLISRFMKFLSGSFRSANTANIKQLLSKESFLTVKNRSVLRDFSLSRNGNIISRVVCHYRSGVKRNGFLFNIALWIGVFLKKN